MFPYQSLARRQGCGKLKRGRAQKAEAREFFHCTLVPKIPAVLQGEELVLFFSSLQGLGLLLAAYCALKIAPQRKAESQWRHCKYS